MRSIGKLDAATALALFSLSISTAQAQTSGPHPPWFQSTTYYDDNGDIVGEIRWYCDGRVVQRGAPHLASYEEFNFYYECPA